MSLQQRERERERKQHYAGTHLVLQPVTATDKLNQLEEGSKVSVAFLFALWKDTTPETQLINC